MEGNGTRPGDGGGIGGQLMEGGGSPRWVVMTQNRRAHVQNIEKLIKFDEI